jgi:hypothetical protein
MDHLLSGVIFGLGFKPRKITPKFWLFLLKTPSLPLLGCQKEKPPLKEVF